VADHPVINLLALLAGGYLLFLWWTDTKERMREIHSDLRGRLPGATLASPWYATFSTLGAIGIVIASASLEKAFHLETQQTTISWLFLPAMLGAAVTEEVVFRGYLVIENKGRYILWGSIIGCSLLFAMIHPYLWFHTIDNPKGIQWITTLRLQLEAQTLLATGSIFTLSLWFYFSRFSRWNPKHSLLPCFCAHAGANLAVFMIKLFTGYVA